MLNNTQTLADLLHNTGTQCFKHESTYATTNAFENLRGRTHYADPDTLKFHYAKILSASHHCSGTVFVIIESVSLDWDNTKRGYRFVVFDVFGTIIEQVDLEHCWKKSDAARKAFWDWMDTFDPFSYYAKAIKSRAEKLFKDCERLETAFNKITNPSDQFLTMK